MSYFSEVYGDPELSAKAKLVLVYLHDRANRDGKDNNRKQTFDAVCRTMLFDISRKHGVHLEQEPSYGGRAYLEKQDYILMKQMFGYSGLAALYPDH